MIAPAKLNLGLWLGPTRPDGLHELCSIFQPLSLADRITVEPAPSDEDEVVCEGVAGENLAGRALAALRAEGWQGEALRVTIDKRIPVAAGLGGGSADAAAVLRLAADDVPRDRLHEIAAALGADVPSQLDPRPTLVRGAGESLEPLPEPREWAAVLIPDPRGLSTPEVFAEADRLALGRSSAEIDAVAGQLREAAGGGASPLDYAGLLANDLEPAAISLLPDIGDALGALREAGAALALMTGSGPTVFGLFPDIARADAAASGLPHRYAGAIVASPARWR